MQRVVERIKQYRLHAHLIALIKAGNAQADRESGIESQLSPFTAHLLYNALHGAIGAQRIATLSRERQFGQSGVARGIGCRKADTGTALASQAFEVVAAQTREKCGR